MTTTLDDYTHLLEQEIDPRLAELLRICDRHIHPSLNDKQAYRWGRLIAATCACRLYYHSLRAKHQLPNPRRQALQMGLSNPQNFRQLSRGDLYAEQIMRRTRGFKVRAFSLVYTLLTQEGPTPPRWTPAEADLVRVGFDHQILGLENLRRLGTEALNAIYRRAIGLSAAEVDDEEEEEPVASDDEAA